MNGIEDIGVHCGVARISTRLVIERRGLDPARYDNLMMEERSVQLPWEDPVTNAVNAARPVVEAMRDKDRIELLVTSTESGVDYSKSVASYVHEHLGLSRRCRVLEVKQACYGATGMVQLAAGYLSAGAKALVIATDVNPMDAHALYAESTTGHGAVAMLVGDEPKVLTLDRGAYGLNSFEIMDTARPAPDRDLYRVDDSLLAYLQCLSASYRDYAGRVDGADFVSSFDHVVMHTPFAGMVKAAHRKLMRELYRAHPDVIADDFARRVAPSLRYPRLVGNLFSGSVYLGLASLIDTVGDGSRVGFYSYGSGCASEFFSGVVTPGAAEVLGRKEIEKHLAARRTLTFEQYEELLPAATGCLVPVENREVDLSATADFLTAPSLVLRSVENHHRKYEWR